MSKTKSMYDQERLHSPPKDNHDQLEAGELCGSYLCKSSQVEAESSHHENEPGVSAFAWESYSMEDGNQGEEMEDILTFHSHSTILKETFSETLTYELTKSESVCKELGEKFSNTDTEKSYSSPRSQRSSGETKGENIFNSRNSPTGRTPELPKSPATVRQKAVSAERSPCMFKSSGSKKQFASGQGLKDQSYSSRSHTEKHSGSPNNSGLGKEIRSADHLPCSGRQDSGSSLGSRQRSHHMDSGCLKSVVTSPRNHYSPQNHRRRDRSVSRSPVRQRDSSSGYKRDYSYRSRSRSPNTRNHHRRFPRRRYSPRCKPSPSGYRSRHRSPQRRPWSPPHNRSTGVGKPGKNLFVAGFSFLTSERDLERKFSRYGRVREVRIVRDKRSGDSRGFGFLSLERDEEADAAIRALDKTEWNGRIVLVEKSKSR